MGQLNLYLPSIGCDPQEPTIPSYIVGFLNFITNNETIFTLSILFGLVIGIIIPIFIFRNYFIKASIFKKILMILGSILLFLLVVILVNVIVAISMEYEFIPKYIC